MPKTVLFRNIQSIIEECYRFINTKPEMFSFILILYQISFSIIINIAKMAFYSLFGLFIKDVYISSSSSCVLNYRSWHPDWATLVSLVECVDSLQSSK